MRIRRRAAAEEPERGGSGDFVPCPRRDKDRVARADRLFFAVHVHLTRAFKDEIKFLAKSMIMALRVRAHGERGLGETLVLNGSIGPVENAADTGPIFCGKWLLFGEILDDHSGI